MILLDYWRRCFAADERALAPASGLTLAFAGYLLLWPTVGMRFSGIEFQFMFDWVPIARYEQLWRVIAARMRLKSVWPYALLVDVSNGALEILAELSLLVLVSALAWPSRLRALRWLRRSASPAIAPPVGLELSHAHSKR